MRSLGYLLVPYLKARPKFLMLSVKSGNPERPPCDRVHCSLFSKPLIVCPTIRLVIPQATKSSPKEHVIGLHLLGESTYISFLRNIHQISHVRKQVDVLSIIRHDRIRILFHQNSIKSFYRDFQSPNGILG